MSNLVCNLVCIAICILISFISCAIFMSTYKEDFKTEYISDKNFIYSLIRNHTEQIDILRARVYDLENKVNEITKEMEKLDDGK